MKKALIATASIALGAGVMYWIYGPDSGSRSGDGQDELSRVRAYAAAEVEIERLRKPPDGAVDWDAVRKQLAITLVVVREIDKAFNLDYEKGLVEALDKCVAGDRSACNQQLIAKGLQHVTVLAIRRELAAMALAAGAHREAAAKRAVAFFEGIRPTLVRRDKDFFPGRGELVPAADAGLRQVMAASRLAGDTVAAGRQFEQAIFRTYALSVLYEVQEIQRLRHSYRRKCEVKRIEGQMFYRIIRPRIKQQDALADETIRTILSADYDNMDPGALESALRRGLGRIPLR